MSEICNEVRFISQLALDGITLTRNAREKASQHREGCNSCMNFHQTLIQATALASDIPTEDVFNAVDLTAVAIKLHELIESTAEPGVHDPEGEWKGAGDSEPQASSIESRLQALLGPQSNEEQAMTVRTDPELSSADPADRGQLLSSVEKDGRLIETWLDKDGWTATRIRWLPGASDVQAAPPQGAVVTAGSIESSAEKSRHSIFELTESDVDAIFGRMLTSRSKERRTPEKVVIGFSVSPTARAELGKIATDKLDPMIDSKGGIRDLGKFLLDPEAINAFEKIIKSGVVNALVNRLTAEQSAVLERLQSYIHQQHSVIGTLVVGRDGLVLSARYRSDEFSEELANWALCAYINSKTASELLNSTHLYHIILGNSQGDVIITDLGKTFLITVTEGHDDGDKEALMRKLETLLA
ncbi:MAG: roadblock/LC7 domain-containing protein [Candidatus Obscuribacterales bacterium]|nr:roadblock/LC7 domain-containing protein [Candidatus Obscuribacterales bacterium]